MRLNEVTDAKYFCRASWGNKSQRYRKHTFDNKVLVIRYEENLPEQDVSSLSVEDILATDWQEWQRPIAYMNFREILPFLKNGAKINRKGYNGYWRIKCDFIVDENDLHVPSLSAGLVLSNEKEWYVVE